jgi:hypothetical protein
MPGRRRTLDGFAVNVPSAVPVGDGAGLGLESAESVIVTGTVAV